MQASTLTTCPASSLRVTASSSYISHPWPRSPLQLNSLHSTLPVAGAAKRGGKEGQYGGHHDAGQQQQGRGLKGMLQEKGPSPSPPQSPSPVPATPSRASSSSVSRSLKLIQLQRNGGRASDLSVAPLLRDSSDSEASLSLASSRFSMSSSSSSSAHNHDDFPRHSLDSFGLTPQP